AVIGSNANAHIVSFLTFHSFPRSGYATRQPVILSDRPRAVPSYLAHIHRVECPLLEPDRRSSTPLRHSPPEQTGSRPRPSRHRARGLRAPSHQRGGGGSPKVPRIGYLPLPVQ